jgi:hypothetical protein
MSTITDVPLGEPFKLTSKILDLRLDNFFVTSIPPKEEKIDKDKITFEFNVAAQINLPEKKFNVVVISKIFREPEKKTYLGEIKTTGEFNVEDLGEILKKFNGMPQQITATYLSIVIGAMRGMFVLESQKTYLKGVIMPVLDMSVFFQPPPQVTAKK